MGCITWIGGKIRNNKDEELNYWWTEGFTDFYSRLIAFRSGGINQDMFTSEMNKFLRDYYLSHVNREPNSRIKKDFWNNYDIEKLPYYRGFVFAIYLNNMIKQQNYSNSLDKVMHDLFKISPKKEFSTYLFKDIIRNYVKNGIDDEILNFIDQGHVISLENVRLPIEKILIGRYCLGFNRDIFLKEKVIKNIDIKSNAYKSGLRDGQKIIGYDCPSGQGEPNQIITIETTDGAFKFRPEHYKKIEVYQLKEKFSKKEEKQFNEFFGIL